MGDINSTSNVTIWDEEGTKSVDVVTAGGQERLAVDASVSVSAVSVTGQGTELFKELFLDDTLDTTTKWTETIVGSATKTLTDNTLKLSTTTGATDCIKELSVQTYPGILANSYSLICAVKLGDTGKANNVRLWGMGTSDSNDGAIFNLDGTSLYAETRHDGVATQTDLTSKKPTDGEYHTYLIAYIDGKKVEFYIDGVLEATHNFGSDMIMSDKNISVLLNNYNSAGTSGSSDLYCGSISLVDDSKSGVKILGVEEDSDGIIREVGTDNRGRLLISGEVGSVTRAENPIFFNVTKSLATTSEILFVDKDVPSAQTWYITSASMGNEQKSRMRIYQGLERDKVETFSGDAVETDFTLANQAIPLNDYIAVTVGGTPQTLGTDYDVIDDPDDDSKSIISFSSAPASGTDNISVTYDAVNRVSVIYVQTDTSFQETWESPLKLVGSDSEFIVATIQNEAANAADSTLNLNGFYEE